MIKTELYECELMDIPANIIYFRKKSKLTRRDICEKTGIDYSWLSKAERAETLDLKLSTALALCDVFAISINDLIYGPQEHD